MRPPPRSEYWVLSLSGGKDSTALGLEWLTRHQADPATYPLDEVIYCDTGMEFPQMVEHINRLEVIFRDAGIKFTRLKAEQSFEEIMFQRPRKDGTLGAGWPGPRCRWCTGLLKTSLLDAYKEKLEQQFDLISLIGFAKGEEGRLYRENNQNESFRYPLMGWGWEEPDCLAYCYSKGFDWGGLYEIFGRVSCWCCPLQSLQELRKLRKHFPDLWARLLDMEHRTWRTFRKDFSVDQLEIRFQFEEERIAQGKPINTREFHRELKKRIKECEQP
ncbi:MAG: phosphoadenosine phosphosulfate reductase family protein [Clostridiaceae bacterium]|nr:phosphoadenosine phosphosulfate reductase family protein [Clostridiaceae bacterium]